MANQLTSPAPRRLTIMPEEWYGWTMWPGYGNAPYHSPIQAKRVRLAGDSSRRFDLEFVNAGYAMGVQTMTYRLRTLVRSETYILATVEDSDRSVAIVPLTLGWCRSHMPDQYERLKALVEAEGLSIGEAVSRLI